MKPRLAENIDVDAISLFTKLRKIRAPLATLCLLSIAVLLIYLMIRTITDNQSQIDFKSIIGYMSGLLIITIIFFRSIKRHIFLFSNKSNFIGDNAAKKTLQYTKVKQSSDGLATRYSILRERLENKEIVKQLPDFIKSELFHIA